MTDALIVLAALLTALQFWDGWTTYQALKLGATERNPIVSELMDTFGTYPALVLLKVGAAGLAWWIALVEGNVDTRAAILALLMALYLWAAVGNWQALQKLKGK